MSHADWATINKEDEQRRTAVRELLAHDGLHTGKDFEQAAFAFRHGRTPDDYLLAHTLAMIAVARGSAGALWIAPAGRSVTSYTAEATRQVQSGESLMGG